MVGASAELFAKIKPLLAMAATEVTHCGGIGCGQIAKIMNNMILAEIVVAISEALAIGTAAGIDGKLLYETLSKGSADSFALRNHGMKAILPGVFPREAFSTRYAIKDLDCALALARDAKIEARGAHLARALLQQAEAAGFGDEYFPVVSRIIAG
jgi:3-hydroxyisobutyrate dehydrogenase